jgi:hypothetical protein
VRIRSSETAQRPLSQLRQVAAHWGWSDLQRFTHKLPADERFPEKLVTWYESCICEGSRRDLFLQINEYPIGQKVVYSAAVYAPRYRLNSCWHVFKLPRGEAHKNARIIALTDWLHYDNFVSAAARKAYRIKHPPTVGYSWKKIGEGGPVPFVTECFTATFVP